MPLSKDAASRKDAGTLANLEHRHFATIATIIKMLPVDAPDAKGFREGIARHFADELPRTNPKFDQARFLRACGVKG